MARAPERFNQDPRFLGSARLEPARDGVADVYYVPNDRAYEISTSEWQRVSPPPHHLIARFDKPRRTITTWPMFVTLGPKFMTPRYRQITTIVFEGYDFSLPVDEEEALAQMDVIPTSFNTVFEFGLGIIKRDAPVIKWAQSFPKATTLCVSAHRPTQWQEPVFVVGHHELWELHETFRRIADRYTRRSLAEREVLAHNHLLTPLDPETYPEKKPPYAADALADFLSVSPGSAHRLTPRDRSALVEEVSKRRRELADASPSRLFRLQRDIEVVNLDMLIERFVALLAANSSSELRWQELFQLNPFILSMLFGHPIVEVRGQVTVSSPMMDGRGARIADFMVRNPATSGVALIELKTPQTPLLAKRPYRGRVDARPVHGPSPDLGGAMAQVLDQRHSLKEEISAFRSKNRSDHEAFGVDCVVLAGRSPADPEQIKDFELYRANLKDVRVITFDELLASLQGLRALLKASPALAPPCTDPNEDLSADSIIEPELRDDDFEENEDDDDEW